MKNSNIIGVKKTIKSTEDLYNLDPLVFKDMLYVDVLKLKIKSALLITESILEQHYMKRDYTKLNIALAAISFNEELLKEMKMK